MIQFNAIIEMVGRPKEHIQKTIKEYVEAINKHEKYKLVKKSISKPKKTDDDFYSAFAEIEVSVDKIEGVFAFCFNFMPASIEILEPTELKFDNVTFTDIANELQAKLHEVDMVAKQVNQKNAHMNDNFNALMTNFVRFICAKGPRTAEEIGKVTGLGKETVEKFAEQLVAIKKLKKENDKYLA